MTQYIPDQPRVSGAFPVVINGVTTTLTEGSTFTDTVSLLAALDAAGISYITPPGTSLTGSATGRIRLNGTGLQFPVGINGAVSQIAMGAWFTPTAAQLWAIGRAPYLSVELEYSTAPIFGNELWAQPGFDASTGITLNGWTITGGEAVSPASTLAMTATALETLVPGQYQVIMGITVGLAAFQIAIGSTTYIAPTGSASGAGTYTSTVTVASVSDQLIRLKESAGDGGYKLTSLSVKRAT